MGRAAAVESAAGAADLTSVIAASRIKRVRACVVSDEGAKEPINPKQV